MTTRQPPPSLTANAISWWRWLGDVWERGLRLLYFNGKDVAIDCRGGTLDLIGPSVSTKTTETVTKYVTIKVGGVSRKVAILE